MCLNLFTNSLRKSAYNDVQKCISEFDHVLAFKELPDGQPLDKGNLQTFISKIARLAEQTHETIESLKAVLKVRGI